METGKSKATATAQVFMVHTWLELIDDERSEWRGKVQHIQSGEVQYFRGLESLAAVIETRLKKDAAANQAGR